MKHILLIIIILSSSCSTISELNKQVVDEHRNCLKTSPFSSAETAERYMKPQKKLRESYIGVIDSVLKMNPQDTVYLIESHDHICINCPADLVQIWTSEDYIKLKINDSTYNSYNISIAKIEKIEYFNTSSVYHDIRELKDEMRKGINWWEHPSNYGTERCSDGSHSFYTVFFRDRIESMYMRCYH
tara:strand:- start:267 stop:824 length:558 start_codon:yes stop_codon:yes gene_type:complete